MNRRKRPPSWFRWTIWAGIAVAVAAPAACLMKHGEPPPPSSARKFAK